MDEVKLKSSFLSSQMMDPPTSPIVRSLRRAARLNRSENRLIGIDFEPASSEAIIGYHEDSTNNDIVIELHRLIGGQDYLFVLMDIDADKYRSVRDKLIDIAGRLTPLALGKIPDRSGFCVREGIYTEDGPHDIGGNVTLIVHFPEHPNVTFSVVMYGLEEKDVKSSLGDSIRQNFTQLAQQAVGLHILHKGSERYADQSGYEIDISGKSKDNPGTRMQRFYWNAEGILQDSRHPFMEVQLITGEFGPSSLSDKQARELWKQLVNGIRLFPGSQGANGAL